MQPEIVQRDDSDDDEDVDYVPPVDGAHYRHMSQWPKLMVEIDPESDVEHRRKRSATSPPKDVEDDEVTKKR
jgi:hypothetical protein